MSMMMTSTMMTPTTDEQQHQVTQESLEPVERGVDCLLQPGPLSVSEFCGSGTGVWIAGLSTDVSLSELHQFLRLFGELVKAEFVPSSSSSFSSSSLLPTMRAKAVFADRGCAEDMVFELGGQGCQVWLDDESGLDTHNVFVRNLPASVTEVELAASFALFGPVVSTGLLRGKDNVSRGMGFARFKRGFYAAATDAVSHFHGLLLSDGEVPIEARLAFKSLKISSDGRFRNEHSGESVGVGASEQTSVEAEQDRLLLSRPPLKRPACGGSGGLKVVGRPEGNWREPGMVCGPMYSSSSSSSNNNNNSNFMMLKSGDWLPMGPAFVSVPGEYLSEGAVACNVLWTTGMVPYLLFRNMPPLVGRKARDGVYHARACFDRIPSADSLCAEFDLSLTGLPLVRL